MSRARFFFAAAAAATLAACGASDSTAPLSSDAALARGGNGAGGGTGTGAVAVVSCELRSGVRSRVSVNGKNLTPANAFWSTRITSGGVTVAAPLARAVGDEVEFDYDSNPADIAAGAVAIPANYIVVNAGGADVTAQILDANGAVVVSGGADCRVR